MNAAETQWMTGKQRGEPGLKQDCCSFTGIKMELFQMFPGISFDLSPLRKVDGGHYNTSNENYDFFINVCGNVQVPKCPQNSGACQSDHKLVPEPPADCSRG